MRVTNQPLPQPHRIVIVEDDLQRLDKLYTMHWEKVKGTIDLPGFEKGQVPQTIAEKKMTPELLYRPVIDRLIREGLAKNKIDLCDIEDVAIQWQTEKQPLVIYVRGYYPPKILSCDYKGIIANYKQLLVTEAEVLTILQRTAISEAVEEEFEELTEKDTDAAALVSFIVDDVKAQKVLANQPNVKVLTNKQVWGFEPHLIGKKKGDVFTTKLILPDSFFAKEFVGKEVSFQVKVHKLFKTKIPPVDDILAEKVGFKNLEEMKNRIRQDLEAEKRKADATLYRDHIMALLIAKTEFTPIPDAVISRELTSMLEGVVKQANKIQGHELNAEEYLASAKTTKEQWFAANWQLAVRKIKGNMALLHVAACENINPDEARCNEMLQSILPDGTVLEKDKINQEGLKFYTTLKLAQDFLVDLAEKNKQASIPTENN